MMVTTAVAADSTMVATARTVNNARVSFQTIFRELRTRCADTRAAQLLEISRRPALRQDSRVRLAEVEFPWPNEGGWSCTRSPTPRIARELAGAPSSVPCVGIFLIAGTVPWNRLWVGGKSVRGGTVPRRSQKNSPSNSRGRHESRRVVQVITGRVEERTA
jgi:hypothetical protein